MKSEIDLNSDHWVNISRVDLSADLSSCLQ